MKRGNFFLYQRFKKLSVVSIWLFSVWFHFFVQLHFNKPYLISVPEIVEIMHAIYQGLSKKQLCKEYVGRKVNNMSGFNLSQHFAFALYYLPRSQRNNLAWASNSIKNWCLASSHLLKNMWSKWDLDLSLRYGHVILASGYLVLTGVQYQRCTSGNGAILLVFKVWGWCMEVRTVTYYDYQLSKARLSLVTKFNVKTTVLSGATCLVSNSNNISSRASPTMKTRQILKRDKRPWSVLVCFFRAFCCLWRQRPTSCHWKRSRLPVTTTPF